MNVPSKQFAQQTYLCDRTLKVNTFAINFLLCKPCGESGFSVDSHAWVNNDCDNFYNFEILFNVADAPVDLDYLWKEGTRRVFSLDQCIEVTQKEGLLFKLTIRQLLESVFTRGEKSSIVLCLSCNLIA